MGWREIWRRLHELDLTVKDTGNTYLELELAPAPLVVWEELLKGAIKEMSRWRSGRWLGGLGAGKKQFAEVLFVSEGAQASTGEVLKDVLSVQAFTGFKQNIINLKGKFTVLAKIS